MKCRCFSIPCWLPTIPWFLFSCCSEFCARIVLNCLFCRFYDLLLMLPETCERAAYSICPAYMLFTPPAESAHNNNWNCSCDFDCGLMDACHETGECLELAMEISEVCYHWGACKPEDVALLGENFSIPHHFGKKKVGIFIPEHHSLCQSKLVYAHLDLA